MGLGRFRIQNETPPKFDTREEAEKFLKEYVDDYWGMIVEGKILKKNFHLDE